MNPVFKIGSKFMNSVVKSFQTKKGRPNTYFVVLENGGVYSLQEVEGVLNSKEVNNDKR